MDESREICGRNRDGGAAHGLHHRQGARQADRRQFERRHQAGGAGQAAAGCAADDPEEPAGLPARADEAMSSCRIILLAAALSSASAAGAQPSSIVESAIAAGQAGERYDGYMGVVGPASPQLTRQIQAINIRRRNLYIELASRRNVTPQIVGIATGCELL